MIANVIVGVRDIKRASTFYDTLFATLGYTRVSASDTFVGYSAGSKAQFWICLPRNGQPASAGNGSQISLVAKDVASVDRFHAAALAQGGKDEGKPGFRPPEKKVSYACYVRDPDGNKLMAVCCDPK